MNSTRSICKPDEIKRSVFIGKALARKNNGHLEKSEVPAGKEAIIIARECIRNNWNFTVEITLTGGSVIRRMRDANEQGFEIIMFYVGLGDVRLNIERVAC